MHASAVLGEEALPPAVVSPAIMHACMHACSHMAQKLPCRALLWAAWAPAPAPRCHAMLMHACTHATGHPSTPHACRATTQCAATLTPTA